MTRPVPEDVVHAFERLRDRVRRTPIVRSPWLSAVTGADVWLKLENQQIEGSFKLRGAFHALSRARVPRAVTASAGNHGRAMAFAAKQLNIALTVFAPRTAPAAKLDPIRRHGARLELCASYDETERRALEMSWNENVPYISPYNHPDVIAGAGTVGLAAMEDLPGIEAFIVPVGGGGLISGIALATRLVERPVAVIGVEANASPVFTSALSAGRLVTVDVKPTLADGLAGNAEQGAVTFDLIRDHVSDVLAVDEPDIANAMACLERYEGQIVEGAAAVGVAALLGGIAGLERRRVVAVISGGNVDRSAEQEPRA